jgi:hypothetical protein
MPLKNKQLASIFRKAMNKFKPESASIEEKEGVVEPMVAVDESNIASYSVYKFTMKQLDGCEFYHL